MEGFGGISFCGIVNSAAKKKRSSASRRPRRDQHNFSDYHDNISSLSSSNPSSENLGKVSSDENNVYDSSFFRKEKSLNQCISNASLLNPRISHLKGKISGSSSSDLAEVAIEGLVSEKKLNKLKLKVGGITRTIRARSSSNGSSVGGSLSTKSSRTSEAPRPRQKLILQESSDEDRSPPFNNQVGSHVVKGESLNCRMTGESVSIMRRDQCEPLRKSKRAPKRRLVSGTLDDGDDDEIRHLERHKASKHESHKDAKRSRSGKIFKDIDYEEDEELVSDHDLENERKKPRKELIDSLCSSRPEISITTRQRAIQNGKDATSSSGASLIEFPNGLPPAPPRRQKEQLSEVEQQLKKAEAAQRRRFQAEKAAKESEAEAIRKILGQDSARKKREDKNKKRQEELQQEKAANAMVLASNSVRWVIGPTGTVVTFSDDMGLPSIFESKPCSYPPPREKCAGPSCKNPYKYRDSKSKLPLCSLQCYKAVHDKTTPPLSAY